MNLSALALSIAISNIGRKEATGNNDGCFVHMLEYLMAGGGHSMDGQPWCAAFATYCINQAAQELKRLSPLPLNPSSSDLYSIGKSKGILMSAPTAPCIGLIRAAPGGPKTHDHTFFVESISGSFVNSVDGNWNNQVMRTNHFISACDFLSID
jgi:hypothetical protein